jgi:hypothetical protein
MSRYLLAAGAVLFAIAVVLALLVPRGRHHHAAATQVTVTLPAHTTPAPPTTTAPAPPPPPPPSPVPMSWDHAGAIVWHMGDVDPTWLGQQMRAAGFGWLAVYLNTPPDPNWLERFREASGNLPVGGWSVLKSNPQRDAATAARDVTTYGLAFYIADAEEPYGYTDLGTTSDVRFARSRIFVTAFRKLQPDLPAAVSSYCRPDMHDLDWSSWANAGFEFLPQAYVNDFGSAASPSTCTSAAAKWFPPSKVHPTIASYTGEKENVSTDTWASLLHAAGTTGFSIYPAEVGMTEQSWQEIGRQLTAQRLATLPG